MVLPVVNNLQGKERSFTGERSIHIMTRYEKEPYVNRYDLLNYIDRLPYDILNYSASIAADILDLPAFSTVITYMSADGEFERVNTPLYASDGSVYVSRKSVIDMIEKKYPVDDENVGKIVQYVNKYMHGITGKVFMLDICDDMIGL